MFCRQAGTVCATRGRIRGLGGDEKERLGMATST